MTQANAGTAVFNLSWLTPRSWPASPPIAAPLPTISTMNPSSTSPTWAGMLIWWCPVRKADDAFAYLAAFSRSAPLAQQHDFWQRVGLAVVNGVGELPSWASTSGLGVYWLHVRLDARPKYYTFRPYAIWPQV